MTEPRVLIPHRATINMAGARCGEVWLLDPDNPEFADLLAARYFIPVGDGGVVADDPPEASETAEETTDPADGPDDQESDPEPPEGD